MEWRTYTPDGKVLTVRRATGRWAVECEGTEREHEVLSEAIRSVIGGDEGVTPVTRGGSQERERWAEMTARHILGDAEADLP